MEYFMLFLFSLLSGWFFKLVAGAVTSNRKIHWGTFVVAVLVALAFGIVTMPTDEEMQEIADRREEIKQNAEMILGQVQRGDFVWREDGEINLLVRVDNRQLYLIKLGAPEVTLNLYENPQLAEGILLIPRILDGIRPNPEWETALDEFFKQ